MKYCIEIELSEEFAGYVLQFYEEDNAGKRHNTGKPHYYRDYIDAKDYATSIILMDRNQHVKNL